MKSFGRLLQKLRGPLTLSALARRTALDEHYLAGLETGRQTPDEFVVRHILTRGFGLDQPDTTRFVLGLQLYDLGLRDTDLRQLVVDLITKESPKKVVEQLRRIYRSYSD
jgi:transcriptional regulator with XRE-family HTH domain